MVALQLDINRMRENRSVDDGAGVVFADRAVQDAAQLRRSMFFGTGPWQATDTVTMQFGPRVDVF